MMHFAQTGKTIRTVWVEIHLCLAVTELILTKLMLDRQNAVKNTSNSIKNQLLVQLSVWYHGWTAMSCFTL